MMMVLLLALTGCADEPARAPTAAPTLYPEDGAIADGACDAGFADCGLPL